MNALISMHGRHHPRPRGAASFVDRPPVQSRWIVGVPSFGVHLRTPVFQAASNLLFSIAYGPAVFLPRNTGEALCNALAIWSLAKTCLDYRCRLDRTFQTYSHFSSVIGLVQEPEIGARGLKLCPGQNCVRQTERQEILSGALT